MKNNHKISQFSKKHQQFQIYLIITILMYNQINMYNVNQYPLKY